MTYDQECRALPRKQHGTEGGQRTLVFGTILRQSVIEPRTS